MNHDIPLLLKALDNEKRLQVLDWLKAPTTHFPPQVDGDLIEDGVCGGFLAEKLEISAPALSVHMALLVDAGLVIPTRKKGWVFYRRDEAAIRAALAALQERI